MEMTLDQCIGAISSYSSIGRAGLQVRQTQTHSPRQARATLTTEPHILPSHFSHSIPLFQESQTGGGGEGRGGEGEKKEDKKKEKKEEKKEEKRRKTEGGEE